MDASIFVYHGQSMGENIDAVLLISALIRKKEVNVDVYRAFFMKQIRGSLYFQLGAVTSV